MLCLYVSKIPTFLYIHVQKNKKMKQILYLFLGIFLASCTSNTIYKKPKDLIPKDTMVLLLKDMYIANSARNYKDCNDNKRQDGYVHLVFDKYKIDSTRFTTSNIYYTSKYQEYETILKEVKKELDTLIKEKRKEYNISDKKDLRELELKEEFLKK